jgi:ribosomal protein S4E
VKRVAIGPKKIPFLITHDGRTIRYPDPLIRPHDTIQIDIASGKITDHIRFESGKPESHVPIKPKNYFQFSCVQETWS